MKIVFQEESIQEATFQFIPRLIIVLWVGGIHNLINIDLISEDNNNNNNNNKSVLTSTTG